MHMWLKYSTINNLILMYINNRILHFIMSINVCIYVCMYVFTYICMQARMDLGYTFYEIHTCTCICYNKLIYVDINKNIRSDANIEQNIIINLIFPTVKCSYNIFNWDLTQFFKQSMWKSISISILPLFFCFNMTRYTN